MRSKTLFLIILIILVVNLSGQKHYYNLGPKVPVNYSFDPDQKYKQYLTIKDSALKSKDIKEYAEQLAYYHQTMLQSGMVYFNWTEIETYLQKFLNKIKTANGITKDLKIFLTRDEDNNASAFDNGIVYVDIGLLANTPDEASLVSVLGHEISHSLNNDQKKTYQLENKFKKKSLKAVISTCHGNRAFEARADDYGFNVATSLDYDIHSEYNAIMKFESDYRWYKSQYSYDDPKWLVYVDKFDKENAVPVDSLENFLSSHPNNYQRIGALKKFIAKKNGKQQFIENKELFNTIKQKAKIEQLYIDFSEGNYLDCTKNSFYYHILDQKNPDYIYYVCESLRRLLLYNPKLLRKGFLTHESKDPVFEKNKGILHDISYLSLDSNFISLVTNDSVYGQHPKRFETYQQAYNFFIKKGFDLNVKDIYLTAGLYALANQNTEKANLNLKKHLQTPDANHKEFTNALLDDNLLAGFEQHKKNIIYINEPNYFYNLDGKINYSFIESKKIDPKVKETLNELISTAINGNNELLYEDTLDIVEYNFYSDLITQLQFFKTEKEAQDEFVGLNSHLDEGYWNARAAKDPKDPEVMERRKNFFYLSPEYWKFFKDKSVASITEIVPYIYNVKTPVGNKTYFYLELSYFDPINKKFIYYDHEYLESFTKSNVKKVLKKFGEKINFKIN